MGELPLPCGLTRSWENTETWFITATSCRSVGECRAPSHLDSSTWCFFHPSQRSERKLGLMFCISLFLSFFSFLLYSCGLESLQLQVRKISGLFSKSFFPATQNLQIFLHFEKVLRGFYFVAVFSVCVCCLTSSSWLVWKQPETPREAVFVVSLLWTRNIQKCYWRQARIQIILFSPY